MMLFRQHSLVLAAFALLALLAHQETGVMVSAQVEDKDDNKDKDDVDDDDVMDGPGMDGPGMDGPGMAEQVVTEISDTITDFIDELPTSDDNATVTDDTEDMECTCDKKNTITCMNVEDEEACMCEDGDVVCVEDVGPAVVVTGGDVGVEMPSATGDMFNVGDVANTVNVTIVEAPTSAMDTNANPEPDSQMASSASAASSMISMAISAAGIAAVALN